MQILGRKTIATHMNTRAYFSEVCSDGVYHNNFYMAMPLLGKMLRYTIDLSGAGCGCNAALYLVSMRQNAQASLCNDYYCDANRVCGVACTEVDLQEANVFAWHSTLHSSTDGAGTGAGLGGSSHDFDAQQYGPGSQCIDTTKPIDVAVTFPVDPQGALQAMEVTLTQGAKGCSVKTRINQYGQWAEISQALAAGMTPVVSYWKSGDMRWMDGGPCGSDNEQCSDTVWFSNFSIEGMRPLEPVPDPAYVPTVASPAIPIIAAPPIATSQGAQCSEHGGDCRYTHCCRAAGLQCYVKNEWWASCKATCTPDSIDPEDKPGFQQPWSCIPLGPRTPSTASPTPGKALEQTTPQPQHVTEAASTQPAGAPTEEEIVFEQIELELAEIDVQSDLVDGVEVMFMVGDKQMKGQIIGIRKGMPMAAGTGGPNVVLIVVPIVTLLLALAAVTGWACLCPGMFRSIMHSTPAYSMFT